MSTRRFLVSDTSFLAETVGDLIVRGYVLIEEGVFVHVERRHHRASPSSPIQELPPTLTTRAHVRDATEEKVLEIDIDVATRLLMGTNVKVVKARYDVKVRGASWTVDVFHSVNEGLVLAHADDREIRRLGLPAWCGPEVTDNVAYDEVWLATSPFARWGGA